MSNISQNAIYAILADSVYWDVRSHLNNPNNNSDTSKSNWTPVPSDWQLIKQESHSGKGALNPNGFTARAYKNGNEIVIAYAGTEFTNIVGDWINNNLALGTVDQSEQANQAALFYHEVKHENPNTNIKFTGYSLGGGLAGLMGVLFDKEAVIFNHAPFIMAA